MLRSAFSVFRIPGERFCLECPVRYAPRMRGRRILVAAMINCPYCGKLTDPKLENCPHCGGPMRAKAPAAARPQGAAQHCPSCGNAVQDGDIICVRCGTNLLTGQKIAEEQRKPPAPKRNWGPVALISGVVVLVVLLIGVLVFVFSGDPVAQARSLRDQGNLLGALDVLQQYVNEHGDNAEAQFLLGQLYWQAQNYTNAAQAFERASLLDPRNADAALFQVVALNRTAGTSREAQISALRRVLDQDPGNEQARYLLGLSLGTASQYGPQIDTLENLEGDQAAASAAMGIAHALQGDTLAASEDLSRAVQQEPGFGDATAALGLVAYKQGNTEEAVRLLEQALQQGTSMEPLVRTRLGMLHLSEGRAAQALPLLEAARNHREAAPEAPFFHSLALVAMGRGSEALADLEQMATSDRDYAAEAATELAAYFVRQGDALRAEENLRRAQQAGGSSAKFYTIQGQIQAMGGQFNEAQDSFRMAIQADAMYPAAYLEQGLLLVQREAIPDGIRQLERYLELSSEEGGGGRRNEIELLVTQLRQTAQS